MDPNAAPPPPSTWRLFHRPHYAWEAMYEDCKNAKTSIEFEQYILENDPVGQRFMELFIEKAKQGLKVFVICDMFGSSLLARSPLVEKLRNQGGIMHFYNKIGGLKILTPWLWFPRTHVKTLLVDSNVAYTGGVCMAERMRNWRDTHVRVTGPVTWQMRMVFDDIENRLMGHTSKGIPKLSRRKRFRYFLSRPAQRRLAVYKEFVKAVDQANHYIYITSAYFIPNRNFIKHIKRAHARGVDVRVLVPEHSDVLLADWVRLSYSTQFFNAGIKLFHYQETVLHSKTAIMDDNWGTVGSTNFDVISFFHNREANIVTTDAGAIADLKAQFFKDLERSVEFTREDWERMPLWIKITGYSARLLRAFF